MPRLVKPSAGRTFAETCTVRGREDEGRKAVLRKGRNHTRIASIGPDYLTLDGSEKVTSSDVLDLQPAVAPTATSEFSHPAVVGERGAITIPSATRRRYRLQAGSPVLIEERDEGILIRPAEIVPRRVGQEMTLSELLKDITPESLHPEVDTGPSVGRESW
jgi:AbrB family looped-hinge helix DNA binding protein